MKEQLDNLLDDVVKPALAQHRGGCELLSLEEGVATIKLTGCCGGCPGKRHTFLNNIKPFLMENIEGLKEVKLG